MPPSVALAPAPSSVVAASHAAFRRPISPSSAAAPSHGAVRFLAASSGGMRCRPYNYGEAVVFVAAPSLMDAVRCLAASAGGMRCRPYNYGAAVVFVVAAPSQDAVRFLAASAGGMRCRPYNRGGCGLCRGAISWRCPFLGRLCGRHEMPPLQLDPRSGSGMTDKSKDKDSETLDSCFRRNDRRRKSGNVRREKKRESQNERN